MDKPYRNYYLNRPPAPLLKARLENIAIVPASMLPFKDKWEEVANALPSGSVLIYHSSTNTQQRKILEYVESSFRAKGHTVTNLVIEPT
ncbi:MAG: hypothetical protein Q7R49_06235 [Candidatus Daviesbacteria bacterium]|nr:hypothetical protein [Candidatus Daviesbacteria bacterium]